MDSDDEHTNYQGEQANQQPGEIPTEVSRGSSLPAGAGESEPSPTSGVPQEWTAGYPPPPWAYGAPPHAPASQAGGSYPPPPWVPGGPSGPSSPYPPGYWGGGYPGFPVAEGAGTAPKRTSVWRVVAAITAGVLVVGVGAGFIGDAIGVSGSRAPASSKPGGGGNGLFPGGSASPFNPSSGPGVGSNGSGPADSSAIAAKVDPGIVDINTTIDYGEAEGAGTGMVLTPNGEVLTNNHVVEGATAISVTDVGNGQTYSATVVGYDRTHDVAVIQLKNATGLKTVALGDSSSLNSGAQVVAVGNAGGSGGTPTYAGGTVTAIGQSINASDELTGTSEHLTGMIATNANVVAGDSGGPLVNTSGQVVGMDTAGTGTFRFSAQSAAGFAVPINTAVAVVHQIEAGQSSSSVHVGPTAFLGVEITAGQQSSSGALISGVVSGSPASGAGLGAGDVITSVGGQAISSDASLQDALVNGMRPGQSVQVVYTDTAGSQHTVTVILASGPPA